MASGPKVSVLLELVDRMTQPLNGAGSAVKGFGAKLKSLGAEATDLLRNRLVQGVGLAGMVAGLRGAVNAANEMEASTRRLAGAAKITGVPLEFLEHIAGRAREQFKLSAIGANDFAVEMAKLAEKAGDVGQAAPGLAAFLDIGAARGLSASETLKALQQAILGIDEGTDKLFNKNPSVIYKEFADKIGTTAGKLTDQQKAQALLNAAMEDGEKVRGAYAAYLDSAAGKQEQVNIAIQEAAVAFGQALLPAVAALTPAATFAAKSIGVVVNIVEQFGVAVGAYFFSLLDGIVGIGKTIFNIVTLDFKGAFEAAKTAVTNIRNNAAGAWLATKEIWSDGADSVTATETDFQSMLTTLRRAGNQERGENDRKAAEDVQRRLAALNDEILVKQLMFERNLTEQQAKALLQRQRDLGQATATQVATVSEAYTQLDRLNTLLAAGLNEKVVLAIKNTTQHFGVMAHHSTAVTVPAVKQVGETAQETGADLERTARTAVDAAHGLGLIDDAGKGVVNTMLNVGSAISDAIKGGWTAGGVIGVVAGVGSLLKGLFGGKSPAQLAAERELRKNTETIAENSRRVGDLTRLSSSGGKLASVQSVLAGLGDAISDLGGKGGGALGDRVRQGRFTGILAGALSGVGLGIGDLDSVAKDLGITIRNSEGAFIVQGLRDLLALLGEIEPTKFAETFEGAREKLRSEVDLFDLSDAEQARRLAAIAGGALGSGVLGQRLGGLDFGTAEGRAAGLDAIRQMFTDLPGLSAGDLGGLTGSQFLEVLQDLKALLSADLPETIATGVTDALEGATGGLGDVAPTDTPAPSVSLADLVATATRSESYLASIADYTSVLPTLTAPAGVARPGAVPAITVTIGDVTIQGGTGGRADGEAFVEYVSTELARQLAEVQRARGSAER